MKRLRDSVGYVGYTLTLVPEGILEFSCSPSLVNASVDEVAKEMFEGMLEDKMAWYHWSEMWLIKEKV